MPLRPALLPLIFALAACVPAASIQQPATRAALDGPALPALKTFGNPRPQANQKSNADIATDFLDLSFMLETGRALPVLTRFEEPITVRVTGTPSVTLGRDLNRLLYRLRTEARVKISEVPADNSANITIEAVNRSDIRRILPHAACFVVPGVSSLKDYNAARRSARINWTMLRKRDKLAIFLPGDASPQEIRDCLHEELAQAIGPLNDLYRLPDSVFNDDNVHTVLTGFDMLILRVYYDPALRSGMTRAQVAARLPQILKRINPAGEGQSARPQSRTPKEWAQAVQTALGPGAPLPQRRRAAARALNIAMELNWQDHRRAFSHYAYGRLYLPSDPEKAQRHFAAADAYYARTKGAELHRAYVAAQLASYSVSQGDGDGALLLIAPHIDRAVQSENAALLSTMMMLRAEALELQGRVSEAETVRLDSLGWARYGFGPEWAVRAKLREIESLSPIKG